MKFWMNFRLVSVRVCGLKTSYSATLLMSFLCSFLVVSLSGFQSNEMVSTRLSLEREKGTWDPEGPSRQEETLVCLDWHVQG